MLKNVFKYLSVVFIFSVSLIILINNFRIQNAEDLSHVEEYLKHITADHKINDAGYGFFQVDFSSDNYFEKGTNTEINTVALISLFLIPSTVIIYEYFCRKNFTTEKILFNTGFKDSDLQPPKYFS